MGPLNPQSLLQTLQGSRHFGRSDPAQLESFLVHCHLVSFKQGEVILDQGESNHSIYLIVEGEAQVFSKGQLILTLSQPGELIGEMSVLSASVTAAKVVAQTDMQVLEFNEAKVRCEGGEALAQVLDRVFLSILTDKLKRTTNKADQYEGTKKALNLSEEARLDTQKNLETQQKILSSVLSSISEGVVVISPGQGLLHSNEGFSQMVGQSEIPPDLLSWPKALGLYLPDQKTLYPPMELAMLKALQGEMVQNQEIYVQSPHVPDGRWLLATSQPLQSVSTGGPSGGAVVMLHDFTQKKLEQQLLIQAKNYAEQEAKAKDSFLSMITHEMGTPLNAVIGMTDLLLASDLDEEARELLQTMKGSSESLLIVIRNLLEYNQLDAGSASPHLEPLDLKQYFVEWLAQMKPMVEEQGLSFHTEIDTDMGVVLVDRARLSLILFNLLHNAVKFTDEGEVWIGFKQVDHQCQFWVKDTGIGILPEVQEKLFKPFVQAETGLSRKYPGIGIGLILAKKLVALLGGEIQVESKPSVGTKVSFWILGKPFTQTQGTVGPKVQPTGIDVAKQFPFEILLAEDNLANAMLMKKVLSKLGYSSTWVSNGCLALEAALSGRFDLILMDIQMPQMDGLEATRKIRSQMKQQAPLIVGLTANSEDKVRHECKEVGMSGYLTKPIRVNQLIEVLSQLFGPVV